MCGSAPWQSAAVWHVPWDTHATDLAGHGVQGREANLFLARLNAEGAATACKRTIWGAAEPRRDLREIAEHAALWAVHSVWSLPRLVSDSLRFVMTYRGGD